MYNLRNETIKAIVKELKIDNNPFNIAVVDEFIEHIADADLKAFYMALFKVGAKEFNGLDRVAKVAETFKPAVKEDPIEKEAKDLIDLVRGMNISVYEKHTKSGISFDTLLNVVRFPKVEEDTILLLDRVRANNGIYGHKNLIGTINNFPTTVECTRAFVEAIKFHRRHTANVLENNTIRKAIERKGV